MFPVTVNDLDTSGLNCWFMTVEINNHLNLSFKYLNSIEIFVLLFTRQQLDNICAIFFLYQQKEEKSSVCQIFTELLCDTDV